MICNVITLHVVWWVMWGSASVQRWGGESENGDGGNAVGTLVEDDRQRGQSRFCYIPKLTFYGKYSDHVFIFGRVVQYWYVDAACSPALVPAEAAEDHRPEPRRRHPTSPRDADFLRTIHALSKTFLNT